MRRNVIIFPVIYLVTYEFIVRLMQGGKLKNVFFPNMDTMSLKIFRDFIPRYTSRNFSKNIGSSDNIKDTSISNSRSCKIDSSMKSGNKFLRPIKSCLLKPSNMMTLHFLITRMTEIDSLTQITQRSFNITLQKLQLLQLIFD